MNKGSTQLPASFLLELLVIIYSCALIQVAKQTPLKYGQSEEEVTFCN
jgi:hypothetical protein